MTKTFGSPFFQFAFPETKVSVILHLKEADGGSLPGRRDHPFPLMRITMPGFFEPEQSYSYL
jgi:hypothetical protein